MAVPNDGDDTTENESYAKSSDSLIYLVKDGKDSFISWVVCACGFIARALIIGVLHGFGSFFVEFVKEFNISKECSAWVGSLTYGLSMTFGPFASMLVNRFGNRIIMVLGGLICSSSILAASFVHSIEMMFLTFSLFYGIGACMCITPIMTIATQYFDKYLTIAVGIITAGSSFGTLIYAPMSQALIDSIGWRNTFRCYAGLCSISAMCSLFIKPISTVKKSDEEKLKSSPLRRLIQDLKLWKNKVFVIWTLSITLVMFGFYIPYVHLVAYAEECGLSPEEGSIFVMMLGACTAFGRIVFGKVVQYGYLNRLHMHQFSMVITGTGVMLLPLLKSFGGISAYVICVGLVDGCYVVLLPVLTATLVGVENTVLAWGFLVGASSITFTAGPPLAGALFDMMGSYDLAFHLAGLPIIAGALLLFLIPWAQQTSTTNNVMIAVSEYNVADEYDLADDILNDLPNRDVASTTTLTNCNGESRLKSRSQRRFKTKRYRDQETSTSPSSIHVPTDINEALVMFHENAKMVAHMLENSCGPVAPQLQTKNSRSEMIQNAAYMSAGPAPQGVISIMSVPGGVAIGTLGGYFAPTTPSESITSNISAQPRVHGQSSETSSIRSKTFEDPQCVASDVFSPTPFKIYLPFVPPVPSSTESKQTTSTAKDDGFPLKSPVDLTVSGNSTPNTDVSSPDSRLQQGSGGSNQKQTFENNYVHAPMVSPGYISSQSKLQTIPEASDPKQHSKVENANVADQYPAVQPSSSSLSQTPETNRSQCELDVFTHLFKDDDVV